MSRPIVVTNEPTSELLSLDEAKRHLRLYASDLDDEVSSLIVVARDYCERYAARTLRTAVTRTLKLAEWWCDELTLPYPPILAVSGITYYDVGNASQTLAASNYYVELSTDAGGIVAWTDGVTIPSLYARDDAITITYTAGYVATLPPVVTQAVKCKISELWGAGSEGEVRAAKEACDRLLSLVDWTAYA